MASSYYMAKIHDLKKNWQCPSCNNVTSRRRGTDSPVHSLHQKRAAVDCGRDHLPSGSDQSLLDLPVGDYRVVPSGKSLINDMSCDESLLDITRTLDESDVKSMQDSVVNVQSTSKSQSSITYGDFAALMDTKLLEFKNHCSKHFQELITNLKDEFKSIIDSVFVQMSAVKEEIRALSEKTKVLEADNVSLRAELARRNTLEDNSGTLQNRIVQLQTEIEERDQWSLLNDLEVSGIPESRGESTMHIILAIAVKLGVALDEREVVHAMRVGPIRPSDEASETSKSSRPRPIVVRLVRRALRDALIKSARVRRGSTTADLGLPDHRPCPFYVNERLTRSNRILLGKARDLGNKLKWRFVWSKDGKVLVRQNENSKVFRIRAECDLGRVFGINSGHDANL
ncbi:hypothetical protein MSG28_015435 [Choristoneura fumiferana]|uniref:Uncharacterized protein n=1 Tax=Choristoneura fumiferana TaxID=7141 RepID=A0ACC0KB32_CHOFU|nr:hypothetical protein MSG28_015435 [Choristoneura fumiferana]